VQGLGFEESSEVSVATGQGGEDHPVSPATGRDEPPQERAELPSERDELLAEVRRLEAELGRYRVHAERTSKLFLSAANYAEWARENARHDAEVALRKARARVEKLRETARELERTEGQLAHLRDELARLQALADETRTRLSAFLTAGLQALSTDVAAEQGNGPNLDNLEDGPPQWRFASTSVSPPARTELDRPEG